MPTWEQEDKAYLGTGELGLTEKRRTRLTWEQED